MYSVNPAEIQDLLNRVLPANMGQAPQQQMPFNPQMQMPMQDQQYRYHPEANFYENLVYKLSTHELNEISGELKTGVQGDIQSRAEWEEKMALGLKLFGYAKDATTQDYSASSNIFSSTFSQAVLISVAQICSILLPPGGPVRMKIMDMVEDQKFYKMLLQHAGKVATSMNNFFTALSPEFYPETEQAFWWAAFSGSSFKKVFFDDSKVRPVSLLIKPEDVIINSNASSLLNAPRITHRFYLTNRELKLRQNMGMYADVPMAPYKNFNESIMSEITQKISGIDRGSYNDKLTNVFQMQEVRVDRAIPSLQSNPDLPCPYLITYEQESGAIASVYRNWSMTDPYCKRINDLIHYQFFPGFGVYGLGYMHLMGGNAEAATELLRQLIFAGKMANFPAWIRSKGMRMDKSTVELQPGETAEIETGNKSVQDCFMRVPVSGPNATLKMIKDDLEGDIMKSMNAVNTVVSEMNPNAPVGTTLAIIEQASKVESSVIRRLHKSMSEEFNLMYQLIIHNFDKMQIAFNTDGKQFSLTKEDLLNDYQILPVSDPNLATSTHLLMQSEALSAMYTQFPTLINPRPIVELKLRALKVDGIEGFMIPEQGEVQPREPVIENMDMINGKPVQSGLEQNHKAHIAAHSYLLQEPSIQQDPAKLAAVQAHIQAHYAMDYQIQMQQLMQQQIPAEGQPQDMQMQNQIAEKAAQATQQLEQQRAMAMNGGHMPLDPNQVLMADVEAKKQAMDNKAQVDLLKAENEKYKADLDFEARQRELALREKEIDQKYHLQDTDMAHEANLQEREMIMERLAQENDLIKQQTSEIMKRFANLDAQNHQLLMQQNNNQQQ